MVLEAEFLAVLNHPNIVRLRALTLSGAAGFEDGPCGYFLIIDRLFETLDQRIKRWHHQSEEFTATKKGRQMSDVLTKSIKALPKRFMTNAALEDEIEVVPIELDEVMDQRLNVGKCAANCVSVA